MMQIVVYVLLLVYQTPTGASAGVRQYIAVFPTEAACQAKARQYQPDENAREAQVRAGQVRAATAAGTYADYYFAELAAPRVYACDMQAVPQP